MIHGFMLITRRRAISPYDNPISVWDMGTLLETAERADVDLDKLRIRTVEQPQGGWRSAAASLRQALSSNEGWFVHASEAADLAGKLPRLAWSSRDSEFILQMSKFFGKAAHNKGFFVF